MITLTGVHKTFDQLVARAKAVLAIFEDRNITSVDLRLLISKIRHA